MQKVNLQQAFASFDETWTPKVAGELNGQLVKLARFAGEFVWHHHDDEDELFLVVDGRIAIHLRDRVVELGPGELLIVPRGVEHKPVAITETANVLMFEPGSTRNTGAVEDERTIAPDDLERL